VTGRRGEIISNFDNGATPTSLKLRWTKGTTVQGCSGEGIWFQATGVRHQVSGVWRQVSGIRSLSNNAAVDGRLGLLRRPDGYRDSSQLTV
jgi:hypothetical protein